MKRRTFLSTTGASTFLLGGCVSKAQLGNSPNDCLVTDAMSFTAETDEFVIVTGDNSVETLRFTLTNRTTCSVSIAPATWRIERNTSDGWRPVVSGDKNKEQRTLSRGESHNWSLSRSPHPTPRTDTTTFVVADLSEGTYAFIVTAAVGQDNPITRRATFSLQTRTSTQTPTQ
jgi:hypothetical protein